MKNAIIRNMTTNIDFNEPTYMNLDIDVNLSNLPRSFSYDDVEEALNRAFDPEVFGRSNFLKKVIYNGPATIILWNDGTKTVVKCKEGDPYSPEAGFALAVLKRLTGSNFHRCLKEARKEAVKDEN